MSHLLSKKQDTWFNWDDLKQPNNRKPGHFTKNDINFFIFNRNKDENDTSQNETNILHWREMGWRGKATVGYCGGRGCGIRFNKDCYINITLSNDKFNDPNWSYDDDLKVNLKDVISDDSFEQNLETLSEHDGKVRFQDPRECAEYLIDITSFNWFTTNISIFYENELFEKWVNTNPLFRYKWSKLPVPWHAFECNEFNKETIAIMKKFLANKNYMWRVDVEDEVGDGRMSYDKINLAFIFDLDSMIKELMEVYRFGIDREVSMRWI